MLLTVIAKVQWKRLSFGYIEFSLNLFIFFLTLIIKSNSKSYLIYIWEHSRQFFTLQIKFLFIIILYQIYMHSLMQKHFINIVHFFIVKNINIVHFFIVKNTNIFIFKNANCLKFCLLKINAWVLNYLLIYFYSIKINYKT